ncbi:MAG: DUF456 family protein [Phycisphaerae bacterium]
MDWLWYIFLLVWLLVGVALTVPGISGTWLMVAAHAAYGYITGWGEYVYWQSVVALIVLAALGEVIEFAAGAAGGKSAGGTWRGMVGAIVGGLLGAVLLAVPLPVIGVIIGSALGAFVGAAVLELSGPRTALGPDVRKSLEVGWGSFKGRLIGTLGKLAMAFCMLVVSLATAMPI